MAGSTPSGASDRMKSNAIVNVQGESLRCAAAIGLMTPLGSSGIRNNATTRFIILSEKMAQR